jgi:hypothetical protein
MPSRSQAMALPRGCSMRIHLILAIYELQMAICLEHRVRSHPHYKMPAQQNREC